MRARMAGAPCGETVAGAMSDEEATMHTTIDEQRAKNRTTDRRADLAEGLAYLVVLFSGIVIAVAIAVAAFVI
jgi:hypothetical protein